jgi:hypothetical protein
MKDASVAVDMRRLPELISGFAPPGRGPTQYPVARAQAWAAGSVFCCCRPRWGCRSTVATAENHAVTSGVAREYPDVASDRPARRKRQRSPDRESPARRRRHGCAARRRRARHRRLSSAGPHLRLSGGGAGRAGGGCAAGGGAGSGSAGGGAQPRRRSAPIRPAERRGGDRGDFGGFEGLRLHRGSSDEARDEQRQAGTAVEDRSGPRPCCRLKRRDDPQVPPPT